MSMEFYSETHPVASKDHICEACGGIISIGDRYCRQSGKWECEFFTRAWCSDCEAIMNQFFSETNESEFDYWEVQDFAADNFCSTCNHGPHCNDDCVQASIWHCQKIQAQCGHKKEVQTNA